MLKEFLKKQLAEKRNQVQKLEKALIESEDKEERAQLGETLGKLRDEINETEKALAEVEDQEAQEEERKQQEQQEEEERTKEQTKEKRMKIRGTYNMTGVVPGSEESREKKRNEELEARGKALKEKRAVTVSSSSLLLPKHTGTQLNDTFTPVSTLVDMVATEDLPGGESYEEAYVKSYGTGGITDEGSAYTEAEPEFDYASMSKIKITAYAELSEETKKLPNIDYAGKVQDACEIAVKKKLSQQIIAGTGTKQLPGLAASTPPKAITASKDIEITEIGQDTLNTIVFSYGGDEDVEMDAALILNKKTLKAFSEVRKANGDLAYKIDVKAKTINTIPYVINSNLTDFASASNGGFVMMYGALPSYKVVTFSDLEIKEDESYKFKEGMICYRASVFVGGNVIKQDGFLRVKKKST